VFVTLAISMQLTRRLDWYLEERDDVPAQPGADARVDGASSGSQSDGM